MAVISDELKGFLESGVSINIATRDGGLAPHGTRVWAVLVDADHAHVTAYVAKGAAPRLVADLDDNSRVALAFSRPTDHRSCQIKGVCVAKRPARSSEKDAVLGQFGGFLDQLAAVGIPRVMTAGWWRWPCVALRVRVTDLFHQTPGPGAGEKMG